MLTDSRKRKTRLPAVDNIPQSCYTGEYRQDVYGKMSVTLENKKLIARFEHHKGRYAELEFIGPGRFLATFNDPLYGTKEWTFTPDNGKIKSVTVRIADFVGFTPYEFYKTK